MRPGDASRKNDSCSSFDGMRPVCRQSSSNSRKKPVVVKVTSMRTRGRKL